MRSWLRTVLLIQEHTKPHLKDNEAPDPSAVVTLSGGVMAQELLQVSLRK
jgi:hypothetical protein